MEEIVLAKQAETAGNAEKAAELYEKAFGKTGEDWLAVKAGELYRDAGNLQKGRKNNRPRYRLRQFHHL